MNDKEDILKKASKKCLKCKDDYYNRMDIMSIKTHGLCTFCKNEAKIEVKTEVQIVKKVVEIPKYVTIKRYVTIPKYKEKIIKVKKVETEIKIVQECDRCKTIRARLLKITPEPKGDREKAQGYAQRIRVFNLVMKRVFKVL